MKELPVCIFTRNRTGCAVATVTALLDNLTCTGRELRYIVCDDRSKPGHVKAITKVFESRGIHPTVHYATPSCYGLGAIMNFGLDDAFSTSDKCLRLEDDWLLKRPLDLGPWVDKMDKLEIGSLRLGMMFRKPHELQYFEQEPEHTLYKVCSQRKQVFTFNNQIAVINKSLQDIVKHYPENVPPPDVEKYGGHTYNKATNFGSKPPYVAWPADWETLTFYGDAMAFDHIGVSICGHASMYKIPNQFLKYNKDEYINKLRLDALN